MQRMDYHSNNVESYLPDDCLLIICRKLQNITDRNAFGLTCRHWLHIQNLARRSLSFHFSYNPNIYQVYIRYIPRLLVRFPYLNSISLAGCTELPDSALVRLRDSGSSLQSLSLYCCFGITDNGLTQVSTGCTNLVSITLYRCNITDVGLESLAEYCRSLENINLSYCILISDRGINAIARRCLKLYAFMISYCKGLTGMGFKGCSSTLTYLEADSCMLTPEGLLEVVSGGGLEYLNVSNLRNWVGMDGLGGIGAGSAPRLRFLNLRMCRFVGDESVAAIAKGCPLLEEWSVAVCHEIHISGWSAIGSNCRNLKILHVNRCRKLCDQGLQALRDGCGQLEVLYMHGCRKVTHVGLETFKIQRQDVEIRREECVSIGPCMDDLFAQ
ncbi:F-box/LRR-repeat protein 12 [Elaeis guineensis]|uniref:F-box/LRR-repeat protein 12 n=1 Tax=Elaeis guineensis var. tenera TaxID=51953 RepID=A0A6I9RQE7_ELAGV|nr:F-box/LRR-repeat protein 12 [Elaeis guineensis]